MRKCGDLNKRRKRKQRETIGQEVSATGLQPMSRKAKAKKEKVKKAFFSAGYNSEQLRL